MRISDWSSDVCSSDLAADANDKKAAPRERHASFSFASAASTAASSAPASVSRSSASAPVDVTSSPSCWTLRAFKALALSFSARSRSEEHTSELQSLMRISYPVFRLTKKNSTMNITFYNYFLKQQKI